MSLIFFSFLLCHRCESIVDVILASAAARNIFKSICYITCDVKKYNIVISIYMWCYCRAFFYYIRSSICVNAVHFISGAAWKRLHHRPTEFFKMNCVWMFDWFVFQLKYKMKIQNNLLARWWWWWWNSPNRNNSSSTNENVYLDLIFLLLTDAAGREYKKNQNWNFSTDPLNNFFLLAASYFLKEIGQLVYYYITRSFRS